MNVLMTLELIDSPLRTIVGLVVLGLFLLTILLGPRKPLRVAVGAVVGAAALGTAVWLMQAADWFDGPLPPKTAPWILVTGALLGVAAVGIASRPWSRRVAAGTLALGAALSCGLAVNAAFAITHTSAAIFGVQALSQAQLPAPTPADPTVTVADFVPPKDLPAAGTVGALDGIASPGYKPRTPAVYLPPAAMVKNPPKLPVLVFMMGQPGTPDPTALAAALDKFAAKHNGIAPIAVVADQLAGNPGADPVCADSQAYGAVSTYFNSVLPDYIRSRFHVLTDPKDWTIGGYSNGGACAFAFAAAHPEVWGNVLDVSGNEYPGSEHPDAAIKTVYGGDRAAYEAALPAAQLAAHPGAYAGHTAVYTRGGADRRFGPGAERNAKLAREAGFAADVVVVPGAGHVGTALSGGLDGGVAALAAAWGVAK